MNEVLLDGRGRRMEKERMGSARIGSGCLIALTVTGFSR